MVAKIINGFNEINITTCGSARLNKVTESVNLILLDMV